jgi:SRSO17 transposase
VHVAGSTPCSDRRRPVEFGRHEIGASGTAICGSTTANEVGGKERWRTERVYEDLKGELGLDHFEGRRFRGWYHHVSVALCCFAFLVAERARASPLGRVLASPRFARHRALPAPMREKAATA